MKKINYPIILTGLLLCLWQSISLAQTTPDSRVTKLENGLSVSPEKAMQIKAAYNDHHQDISVLLKNQTMSAKDKARQLKQLKDERQQRINAVISPAQRLQLYQSDTTLISRVKAQTAAIKQRHEQQLATGAQRKANSTTTNQQ
jgi:hypothetical protein